MGKSTDGTLIPLPYPFTTPCASGAFQEMYYWDAYFANKALYLLGRGEQAAFYAQKAAERKEKLLRYCRKDGLFFDYNYAKDSLSTVLSAAALFAYWVGVADSAEGLDETLSRIEGAHGVYCCDYDGCGYQWSKPNSWAPLNWIAVAAARAVGEEATAQRLAQKYLSATEKIFAETGNLWEKYNGITGDLEVASEYGTPPRLGWTAGVYVYLKKGER